ncbi:major facilitator superfamily domain-containing protein [Lophiotrema nucula]|uniref:Major facilitator superfamily domain-containing protein n=1 Tax=Lophiotrema nucula TaxID=690887 RepID=A0A6A5YFF4_9PLEO|nr:major facilitator superfamily domain-containing protein [Lophiotrema nucula]
MSNSTRDRKWHQIQWFKAEDTPEERKLIIKLDLLMIPYMFVVYWMKQLDQNNLNYAYVAGMKEDLGFRGNELIRLQSLYVVGAVLGQLPFMYLFTRFRMQWLLPVQDVAWGIFTLLQFRAQSFAELAAYRFMVGWFEAAWFPAAQFTMGSWYRGDEIGRREGLFILGIAIGPLTAALIQSGASARLDGVNGVEGWRWMYIINALMTIPIGFLGLMILPGTPDKPNRLIFKAKDQCIAKARLERAGHGLKGRATLSDILMILRKPRTWSLIFLDIFSFAGSFNTVLGGYALWIKSLDRYSPSRINQLAAIAPGLGILYNIVANFSSDLLWGPAWSITVSQTWNCIGLVILVIWDVPESALWFAFSTTFAASAVVGVLLGWINTLLKASPAERSVVIVLANMIGQGTSAWTQLLTFPTVEAPRFTKGYSFVLANAIAMVLLAHYVDWDVKRQHRRAAASEDGESRQATPSNTNSNAYQNVRHSSLGTLPTSMPTDTSALG